MRRKRTVEGVFVALSGLALATGASFRSTLPIVGTAPTVPA